MNMTRTVAACFRAHWQAAKPSQGEERAYDKDGFAARVHLGSKAVEFYYTACSTEDVVAPISQ